MEIKTKQRIIGIAIIIIILLILIPLLFSGSKKPTDEPNTDMTNVTPTASEISTPSEPTQSTVEPSQQQSSETAQQPQLNTNQDTVNQPNVTENSAPPTNNEQLAPPEQNSNQQGASAEQNAPQSMEQPTPTENANEPMPPNQNAVPANNTDTSSPTLTTPIKVTNGATAEKPSASTQSLSQNSSPTKVKNSTDQLKKWSVQMGSFSEKTNATQLMNKLKGDGFEAHVKEMFVSGEKIYRVFVGQNYNHKKAEKVAQNLEKNYHLKGLIIQNQ